jgi:DNA ligase-1
MYLWRIWTEGPEILVEYGTVDGEKSLTRKVVKGKNIGKSNETTPEEQAVKEAAAQHKKKLDKKYSLTPNKATETVFLPMLAHDYLKQKKKLTFPVDVQPKLEGVRCLAYWEGSELRLMSRGGKPFDVKHIAEEVAEFLPPGSVLDGELYVHGMSQQNINRLWKKHREGPEGSIQLLYVVYDGFHVDSTDAPWWKRKEDLSRLMSSAPNKKVVQLFIDTVKTEKQLQKCLNSYEERGYEGIIIRKADGPYQLGHRSRDLLKLKSFMDEEFEIVGHEEAKGNDKGTVVWICKTKDDQTFSVRPTGTREERKESFEHAEEHYGRFLTVKFQGYTDDGIPYFPVGVAIREPEDM